MNESEHNRTAGLASTRESLYILVPITVLYGGILVSGIVGNVSTCVVVARNKHMHTATNYYLFSLAVSDLLLLVFGLPQEMYVLWARQYVFGEAICLLTGLASETSANATVLTITAFTVERYVAICHPFFSHTVSKLSRAIKFVIAIWLLALCLAVPQAIQFGVTYTVENGSVLEGSGQCTMKYMLVEHAFHISTCVFFVAPMTLITILYILIGLKLRRSRVLKRPSLSNIAERQVNKNQNHVIRMLVAVVVAFFICWAPFHAQRLLAQRLASVYSNQLPQPEHISSAMVVTYKALTHVSGILYYLSTTINPLLYNIMSNKFRDAFKTTLAQLCGGGEKVAVGQTRSYSVLSRNYTHGVVQQRPSVTSQNSQRFKTSDPSLRAMGQQQSPVDLVAQRLCLLTRSARTPQVGTNSANTISNSSLQDLDEPEFTGSELAQYMGQLNNR